MLNPNFETNLTPKAFENIQNSLWKHNLVALLESDTFMRLLASIEDLRTNVNWLEEAFADAELSSENPGLYERKVLDFYREVCFIKYEMFDYFGRIIEEVVPSGEMCLKGDQFLWGYLDDSAE